MNVIGLLCGFALALQACNPASEADLGGGAADEADAMSKAAANRSEAIAAPETGDGLSAMAEPFVAKLQGHYELWENIGDDGLMCEVELVADRTIGGYAIKADEDCLATLKQKDVTGIFAWLQLPEDGSLLFIDATRAPVLRLRPSNNPNYFDNEDFYLTRLIDAADVAPIED